MLRSLAGNLRDGQQQAFWGFALLVMTTMIVAVFTEALWLAILPAGIVGVLYVALNPTQFYYLFFFLLPFSIEVELPGGFGTDLPSEPLMLVLSFIAILMILHKSGSQRTSYFRHPITLFVLLHFAWIIFTSLYSSNVPYSIKFLLAKTWYLLPFYFFPFFLDGEKDYRKLMKFFFVGLFISIAYVMLRHAATGFGFDTINKAVRPIYRNHVNYGIMLTAGLPFYAYLIATSRARTKLLWYLGGTIYLLAIYLTYTRAAHISVLLAIAVFVVIYFRKTLLALSAGLALILVVGVYLSLDNRYLDIAPEYTKAIEHKKFDNLVEATYKMEDISTVERFYRWIAGVNMIKEKPLTGFGPACFYSEYKSYTVTSYKTYVSDNPEQSGIHNYYLMTAVEQGIPGLLIFLAMVLLPIVYCERVFHDKSLGYNEKALVMAAGVSLCCVLAVLLINDLLEADKVGPMFFLSIAIIVYFNLKSQKQNYE